MENNPNAPENLRVKLSKFKSPLTFNEWAKQFKVGYHYRPTIEDAQLGLIKLRDIDERPKYHQYPDLRDITIIGDT